MKNKIKYLLFVAAIMLCGFIAAPDVHAATLHQENTDYQDALQRNQGAVQRMWRSNSSPYCHP